MSCFHEAIFPFASSTLRDEVKTFFPHFHSPAEPDGLFSEQPSSNTHHSTDVASSSGSLPSGSRPVRSKKQPSNLQDFHCYNLSRDQSTPYPIANFVSYTSLSEPFHGFINAITKIKESHKYK